MLSILVILLPVLVLFGYSLYLMRKGKILFEQPLSAAKVEFSVEKSGFYGLWLYSKWLKSFPLKHYPYALYNEQGERLKGFPVWATMKNNSFSSAKRMQRWYFLKAGKYTFTVQQIESERHKNAAASGYYLQQTMPFFVVIIGLIITHLLSQLLLKLSL